MTTSDDSSRNLIQRLGALLHRPQDADDIANDILEDPTAAQWLPEVPSPLLHRLICEIGMGDAPELMELISGDQVREVLDLELWQGDRLKLDEALDWVHFLSDLSDEVAMRHIHALDIELLGFLLISWGRIYLVDDGNVPDEPEGALWSSPDNWFVVEVLTRSKAQGDQVNTLLDKLYIEEPEETRTLLQNLLWELPTELEEWSYRWRTARLEDLGFADPQRSLVMYTYLKPTSVVAAEGTADFPLRADTEPVGAAPDALVLAPGEADSFWSRAVAALPGEAERERISTALLSLANHALAADRISHDDSESARGSLDDLHWRLSLGLEHLCGGDLALSAPALASVALMRLARVGHSLGLDLHRALLAPQREGKLGPRPGKASRFDPPFRPPIEALLRPRPRFFDAELGEARAFQTLADLAEARAWIDRAAAEVALMDRLGLPDPMPEDASLGDIFRTRLINAALSRPDGPLDVEALAAFLSEHLAEGKLSEQVRTLAAESAGEDAAIVVPWLATLEQDLGPLDPKDLDPRFIDGVWLATRN